MIFRPLVASEEVEVRELLASAGLPVEDLDQSEVHFLVAADDGGTIGAIGLEIFGAIGLLRSLAVRSGARGSGLGGRLVEALEANARDRGLSQLVLLTQTAEPFFTKHGFTVIARDAAPAGVHRSTEFRSICPASATCMTKLLEPTETTQA